MNKFCKTAYVAIFVVAMNSIATDSFAKIRIIEFVRGSSTAFVKGDEVSSLQVGQVLDAKRMSRRTSSIPAVRTGRLKVMSVEGRQAMLTVIEDGTAESKLAFPKFSTVMAGDVLEMPEISIVRDIRILPDATLKFDDLFVDPKAQPSSYEITPNGRAKVLEAAKLYADHRGPLLMIEGHTDRKGASEMNQVESYQRALAVRQVLINEVGMDPERVVAIGMGESELPDENLVPGYQGIHRRIVFKLPNMKESD
jgi:hypothetical protein